jgi:uncharacterized membrane protein
LLSGDCIVSLLIVGLLLFLSVHSVAIVAPAWRDRMAARLGEWPWKGLYSVLSVIGLILIVQGYAAARIEPVVLYTPPFWLRHLAMLLLLPVFVLLLAAYLPGRIQRVTKHPMLVATKLWALAHLLVNGTLADVVLFGGFLAWAVADRISLKRRAAPWAPMAPATALNDLIAIIGGIALYLVMAFWLHVHLFGVAPMG